jgi:hypothetical protein
MLRKVIEKHCGPPVRHGKHPTYRGLHGRLFQFGYHDPGVGCRPRRGRRPEGGRMSDLHVVYRLEERVSPGVPERWATCSYPVSIYVAGSDIAEVRAEFRDAFDDMADLLDERYEVVEHVERPLVEGVYIRTAIDRRGLDRSETAQRFEATLSDLAQRRDFASLAPVSGTGDTVVVACVAGDAVGWLTEQMNEFDSLVVCLSTGTPLVWWTWLAGPRAALKEAHAGTLSDAGLTAESTVSDLVKVGTRTAEIGHTPGLLVAAA